MEAAIEDMEELYRACQWQGKLADDGADFMKTELTVADAAGIAHTRAVPFEALRPGWPWKGGKWVGRWVPKVKPKRRAERAATLKELMVKFAAERTQLLLSERLEIEASLRLSPPHER